MTATPDVPAAASDGRDAVPAASSGVSSAMRASPMSRRRRFGSRSRQRATSSRTRRGTSPGNCDRSIGFDSTPETTSATDSPSNNRRPLSISKRTTPKAQMSARRSTGRPRACSGAMYAAVPRMTPMAVIAGDVTAASVAADPSPATAFARPKSSTLTVPSSRTLILAGLRSRCTIPCSCADSSASAIWRAMDRDSERPMARGPGPDPSISASVGPGTSSMTRAGMPLDSSSP